MTRPRTPLTRLDAPRPDMRPARPLTSPTRSHVPLTGPGNLS